MNEAPEHQKDLNRLACELIGIVPHDVGVAELRRAARLLVIERALLRDAVGQAWANVISVAALRDLAEQEESGLFT